MSVSRSIQSARSTHCADAHSGSTSGYQVVQPSEILEFYRDLTEFGGFELETAGVLKEGRKLWALARTGQSATLKGRERSTATCCWRPPVTPRWRRLRNSRPFGWSATTPSIALGDGAGAVKVPHRSQFDAQAVKRQLGIAISSGDGFMARMKVLSECRVKDDAAEAFFRRVLTYPTAGATDRPATVINDSAIKAVHNTGSCCDDRQEGDSYRKNGLRRYLPRKPVQKPWEMQAVSRVGSSPLAQARCAGLIGKLPVACSAPQLLRSAKTLSQVPSGQPRL